MRTGNLSRALLQKLLAQRFDWSDKNVVILFNVTYNMHIFPRPAWLNLTGKYKFFRSSISRLIFSISRFWSLQEAQSILGGGILTMSTKELTMTHVSSVINFLLSVFGFISLLIRNTRLVGFRVNRIHLQQRRKTHNAMINLLFYLLTVSPWIRSTSFLRTILLKLIFLWIARHHHHAMSIFLSALIHSRQILQFFLQNISSPFKLWIFDGQIIILILIHL